MTMRNAKKSRGYTTEEINLANSYSLPDLLNACGYILIRERGGQYHLQEHDSLKISEHNGWKWFSRAAGGKNIDFFMQYENLDFLSAVDKIFSITKDVDRHRIDTKAKEKRPADFRSASIDRKETIYQNDNRKSFERPAQNDNSRRAYAYLVKTRCLDPDLVSRLMKSGYVYEAAETHNAVFLGTDYNNNVVSAFERGTGPKKFARDTAGSNKSYRFRIVTPGSQKLNVFEAEIDMLSYISMRGLNNENYIALGGRSTQALDAFLEESGIKITTVNLCLDNDIAGISASDEIEKKLEAAGGYVVTRTIPVSKDFNEDLQASKSLEKVEETEALV